MNKKIFFIAIITSIRLSGLSVNQESAYENETNAKTVEDSPSNAPTISLTNNNAPQFNQTVTIKTGQDNLEDCTSLQGQRLKDCMACQTKESFRKNMLMLNDPTAHWYWRSLSIDEYEKALFSYNKEQWEEFYASRSDKAKFTATLERLRARHKSAYQCAYHYDLIPYMLFSRQIQNADDLEEVIEDFKAARIAKIFRIFGYQEGRLLKDFKLSKERSFPNN